MRMFKKAAAALVAVAGLASVAAADPNNIGKVIITEIFANPNDTGGAIGDNLEYIEIFNTTNQPIDISGWYIDDEDPTASEPFPPGTILGPRQALVIIGAQLGLRPNDPANAGQYLATTPIWTPQSFNAAFGRTFGSPNQLNVLIVPGNITIANTPTLFNEVPFIVDADGTVVDIVAYGAPGFPPVTAGQSLVLRPQFLNNVDNDLPCAWTLASSDLAALTSVQVDFNDPVSGALIDRLCDAGNVCSPGIVNQISPPPTDCNNNGINDVTETCGAGATSPDCNNNLIPDACEPDLNQNGVPDACDIVNDRERQDRNLNNVLDSTDINLAGGTNGVGGTLDTNNNGILDGAEDQGKVIITEIMVDPFTTITGASLEWVEIQNVSSGPVDISGYRLLDLETGGDGYTLPVPAGTVLAAGEIAVLCQLPQAPFQSGGANYTEAQAVTLYQNLWGSTTPGGQTIRWIPLGRWGARATNATPTAEILTLVRGANIADSLVATANPATTAGPHPTRLGPSNAWVLDRGYIVDVANYSNTNSNGEPLAGWPGSDSHSSFFLKPGTGTYSLTGNNVGPNWALSIGGLNGTVQSNVLSPLPFGVNNTGEDFGSPGFVPTTLQQPTGEIIISEIAATTNSIYPGSNPNPTAPATTAGGRDEWVEIVNTTSSPINLTGWYLQDEDGRTQPFPAGTILQPGKAAVIIGGDTAAPTGTGQTLTPLTGVDFKQEFYNAWGCGYEVVVTTDWYTDNVNSKFGLGRLADGPSFTNEILRLVKPDGVPSDIVNYDDDDTPTGIAQFPFGWPGDAGTGVVTFWSIYTLPGSYTQSANDLGTNWAASLTGFDGGRQSSINSATNTSGFPTGIYNRSMFGSPGFVQDVTAPLDNTGPGCGVVCRADFNGQGGVTVQDIFDFLSAWFGNQPRADFNGQGGITVQDIFDFLSTWFTGCP